MLLADGRLATSYMVQVFVKDRCNRMYQRYFVNTKFDERNVI